MDDDNKFNERVKFAKELQQSVANEVKFTNYCSTISDDAVASIEPDTRKKIIERVLNSCNFLSTNNPVIINNFRKLVKQVEYE